jgi:hypothetical protein
LRFRGHRPRFQALHAFAHLGCLATQPLDLFTKFAQGLACRALLPQVGEGLAEAPLGATVEFGRARALDGKGCSDITEFAQSTGSFHAHAKIWIRKAGFQAFACCAGIRRTLTQAG